mgnify:FL=1
MKENLEQDFNKEKIPDTEIARKLQGMIKEKKAAEGKSTDNPETMEEVQKDLKEMGITTDKEQRLEKMAELAVGSVFGKGVFEKEKPKPYFLYTKEFIDKSFKELRNYKKLLDKAVESGDKKLISEYKEKVKFYREELEKAQRARNKQKEETQKQKIEKLRNPTQLEVDIAESRPESYGNTYKRKVIKE